MTLCKLRSFGSALHTVRCRGREIYSLYNSRLKAQIWKSSIRHSLGIRGSSGQNSPWRIPPLTGHQSNDQNKQSRQQRSCQASKAGKSSAAEKAQLEIASEPGSKEPGGVSAQRCTIRNVPGSLAHTLADTLLSLGAQSASVTEHRPPGKEEQEIFDLQQGTRDVWDSCVVTTYYAPDFHVSGALQMSEKLLQIAQSALELDSLEHELTQLADSDWVEGICASYQPTCISDKLWIIPSWYDQKDDGSTSIRVEPGLAFGTGEHPTTRLCLTEIFGKGDLTGKHIVDYGTGSGVLALTALKLGASLVVGTDTDAVAVRAASQNGVLNKFTGKWITLLCGPSLQDPDPISSNPQGFILPTQFDICVANILQGPLVELRPRLTQYVKPGGLIMLSGILVSQVKEVREAYEEDFEDFQVRRDELWALLVATRKLD